MTSLEWVQSASANMFKMRLQVWDLGESMRQTPGFEALGNEIEAAIDAVMVEFFEAPNPTTFNKIREIWNSFMPHVAVFCDSV